MFAARQLLSATFFVAMCVLSGTVQGVTFLGAKVGVVETRATGFGSIVLMTMLDPNTNQPLTFVNPPVTGLIVNGLCAPTTGATVLGVMALPLSDPAAKAILQMAVTAKTLGLPVAFNTLDGVGTAVGGAYCQIGNFQLQ
jgi:hypothetical protein